MELTDIKGIGAKSKDLLNKLGIITIDDLLTYYPTRYEILKRSDLNNVSEEDKVIIDGRVDSVPLVLRFNRGLNKMNFRLAITNGVVGVSIFNRARPNFITSPIDIKFSSSFLHKRQLRHKDDSFKFFLKKGLSIGHIILNE